jgi:integrase
MGCLYLRSLTYWMKFTVNGKKIYQSTGTSNKKLAQKIYAKTLLEIHENRWFQQQVGKKTLEEMIERYDKNYTSNKAYYQKARDKSIFKHLYAHFGKDCTLEEIENLIGDYELQRRAKGVKPATVIKELGLLRRMFNVARKQWKWKMPNPVSEIELPKVDDRRIRYLTPEEYQRLFAELDKAEEQWLKPFVTVALETGLRLSNLCNLTWSEVNMFNRIISVSAEKMKNRDHLGIPLSDSAYEVLREQQRIISISDHVFHHNGHKLYPVKVQRAFRQVITSAEIKNFRVHDLRHSFASSLVQSGVNIYSVQKLLGHKDGRMTQRYAHLSIENLRTAISNMKNGYNLVTLKDAKGL